MLTGIGGQGVQLAAQVLARAAIREGRFAMLFGVYGGVMRGGNTDSTLVVADAHVTAPPILSRTGSAIAMHHQYFEPMHRKLRPGALVFLNEGLFEGELEGGAYRVVEVPATRLASEVGSALAGSLLMAGAYAAYTGLVGLDSLVEGMRESLPPYRQQHAPLNRKALEVGFAAVPAGAAPVWQAA